MHLSQFSPPTRKLKRLSMSSSLSTYSQPSECELRAEGYFYPTERGWVMLRKQIIGILVNKNSGETRADLAVKHNLSLIFYTGGY